MTLARKSTTRKKTVRTRRTKDRGTPESSVAETPELTSGQSPAAAETPQAAANAKATGAPRSARRPRSRARGGANAADPAAAAPSKEADSVRRGNSKSAAPAGPEIEQGGDRVVIRFPSAAPPPSRFMAAVQEARVPRPAAPAAPAAKPPQEPPPVKSDKQRPKPQAESAPRDESEASGGVAPVLDDDRPEGARRGRRSRRGRGRDRGRRESGEREVADRPPQSEPRPVVPFVDGDEGTELVPRVESEEGDDDVLFDHESDIAAEARAAEQADLIIDESADERAVVESEERGRGRGRRRRRSRRGRGRERGGDRLVEDRTFDDYDGSGADEVVELEATEAVSTAPRAAPRREMVINAIPREECRIAILENNRLEEIYTERASAENHVGNIYKGVVTNVEPSIQAAFLNFGLGKNGFLHISDLHPRYFPKGEDRTENVGRKTPRRARPPIQNCLRRGQELLVQITKEGIGTKGPTLTTYLSVPGRFLVLLPDMRELGVSRKIEDDELRRKIRRQLDELELPGDMGFIARTAAEDRSREELQADLDYLTRLWRAVERRIKSQKAPCEVYRDSDLVTRTIRDVYTNDIEKIFVDDEQIADQAREFLSIFNPRAGDIVNGYESPVPIFHHYGIEAELDRLHSRHVPLKSGGSLVIDQTEALVAIDVNSGRFRTEDDSEITAFKINLEAADEIARQLRLRDLGGVIICDFIDMRREEHRREVERRLARNLKEHKERAKVLRMSRFGMIEMTRQRQRASLTRTVYQDCTHCRGTGLVKTAESVALDVMRLIQLAVSKEHIRSIEVAVGGEVAFMLQNRKRAVLHEFETQYHRSIAIRPEPKFGLDQVQVQCYDQRGRVVPHP